MREVDDLFAEVFVDRPGLVKQWRSDGALGDVLDVFGLADNQLVELEAGWNSDGKPGRREVHGFLAYPVVIEVYLASGDIADDVAAAIGLLDEALSLIHI